MLHWFINDNTCALTIIERWIRQSIDPNADPSICITGMLVEPIFDFRKNHEIFADFLYFITTSLWILSLIKLYKRYKQKKISKIEDLLDMKLDI